LLFEKVKKKMPDLEKIIQTLKAASEELRAYSRQLDAEMDREPNRSAAEVQPPSEVTTNSAGQSENAMHETATD
jgi:hypothetical protein